MVMVMVMMAVMMMMLLLMMMMNVVVVVMEMQLKLLPTACFLFLSNASRRRECTILNYLSGRKLLQQQQEARRAVATTKIHQKSLSVT